MAGNADQARGAGVLVEIPFGLGDLGTRLVKLVGQEATGIGGAVVLLVQVALDVALAVKLRQLRGVSRAAAAHADADDSAVRRQGHGKVAEQRIDRRFLAQLVQLLAAARLEHVFLRGHVDPHRLVEGGIAVQAAAFDDAFGQRAALDDAELRLQKSLGILDVGDFLKLAALDDLVRLVLDQHPHPCAIARRDQQGDDHAQHQACRHDRTDQRDVAANHAHDGFQQRGQIRAGFLGIGPTIGPFAKIDPIEKSFVQDIARLVLVSTRVVVDPIFVHRFRGSVVEGRAA